jgi:hypothetical protein
MLNRQVVVIVMLITVVAVSGFFFVRYSAQQRRSAEVPTTPEAVVAAAGDIAYCSSEGDEATAELLEDIDGTVLTLGDNAYPDGRTEDFDECYDPTWGKFKERTRPIPGNHDYETEGASAYFEYFGAAAGDPQKGYYSYELESWHIIALNSNCKQIGGCGMGSAQLEWLKRDLATNPAWCTLAYVHDPLFSTGKHGSRPEVTRIWKVLYAAGADLVLSGNDHNYQRFAPQDPDGEADYERGIRQFVVGTGGKSHYAIESPIENLQVYNDDTFGVLKLTLEKSGYEWQFVPVEGKTFTDSGSASCHTLPPDERTERTVAYRDPTAGSAFR